MRWCCQRSQSILCLLWKLGSRVLINTDTTTARPMGLVPVLEESQAAQALFE